MTDPQQHDGFRPPAPPPPPATPADAVPAYGAPVAPPSAADPGFPASGGYAAPNSGFAAPGGYAAPNGAYQVPAGGYQTPVGPYAPAAPEPASRTTGILAFVLSLVAAVAMPIIGGIASWEIGRRIPGTIAQMSSADLESLAFLSPARDQVLWAEMSFWAGTILGIAAFILGVIAIVKRRGRGYGIASLVIAAAGLVIFFTVVLIALTTGAAVGATQLPVA